MRKIIRLSNVDEIKVIKVIEVKSIVGEGIPTDPVKQIVEYYDFNGRLLARNDGEASLLKIYEVQNEK